MNVNMQLCMDTCVDKRKYKYANGLSFCSFRMLNKHRMLNKLLKLYISVNNDEKILRQTGYDLNIKRGNIQHNVNTFSK